MKLSERDADEALYIIGKLERAGCTPAQILDFIAVEIGPKTVNTRANIRGVSENAVEQNIRKAKEKLWEAGHGSEVREL